MADAFIHPDRAGKAHLRHPRFSDVTTACGGSLVFLDWAVPADEVKPEDRCPRCWGAT